MKVDDNPVTITNIHSDLKYLSFTVPINQHRNHTILISKPSVVHSWIYRIRHTHYGRMHRRRLVVGLGVQWSPNTNPRARPNPPATLQLYTGHQCLIFQLLHSPTIPLILCRILSNPVISFVGVGIHNDSNLLQNYSRHNLSVSRLIKLRLVAHNRRGMPRGASTKMLVVKVLGLPGVRKWPWIGVSDWEVEWLNDHQVTYASIDTSISFMLGKELKVWHWVR